MQRRDVLAKLFRVSEQLRVDRIKHKRAETANETPEQAAERVVVETIPNSGRNLMRLLKDVESINQRTLAKQLNISAQAVSEVIKKLAQAGFITKECGAQNNENLIALTPAGKRVSDKLDNRIKEHAAVVLAPLTEEELVTLDGLLSKLIV